MENEKRLIDANELINGELERLEALAMSQCDEWRQGQYDECFNGIMRIKIAPTVDAVEVVRCKDCRSLEITGCYGECGRGYMGIVKPYDFCSYGERKDNGSAQV